MFYYAKPGMSIWELKEDSIHILEIFIERSLLTLHCISLAVESGEVLQGEVLLAVLAQVEAVLVPCHNTVTVTCHVSRGHLT